MGVKNHLTMGRLYNNKQQRKGPLGPVARKQVAKIASKQIHRQNPDKMFSLPVAIATTNFSMTFQDLCIIPVLVNSAQRRGDSGGERILLNRVYIEGALSIGTQNASITMILFRWKPNITVDLPTTGDVLLHDGTVTAPFAQENVLNKQKAVIIYRKTLTVDTLNKPYVHFKINKRIKQRVNYDEGDTTGVTGTNHIYFGYVSSTNTAVIPSIVYNISTFFEEN